MYDVIIIGKGPAGIQAAIYAKRANLDTLVIGSDYGALQRTQKIENYYGFEKPIEGKKLVEEGIKQAENIGVKVLTKEVTGIEYRDNFVIKTINEDYKSRAIILATGVNRKQPDIEGIKEFEGKGVSYCAVCDAFFYKQKDVAVLGSGDYAISEAEELAPIAKTVTILTNGKKEIQTRSVNIKCNTKLIKRFEGNGKIENVKLSDNTDLKISGIFIAEGVASSTDLAKKIGVQIKDNKIIVDENMNTNIPGLYAAGDCTGGLLQISKAIYEGTKAGLSAIQFLRK